MTGKRALFVERRLDQHDMIFLLDRNAVMRAAGQPVDALSEPVRRDDRRLRLEARDDFRNRDIERRD